MPRFCTHCGRPLDPEHHDLDRYPEDHERAGEPRLRVVIARRGRGRLALQKVRVYGCRVRPIADSPTTGRRLVPASMQRERHTGLSRYAHVDNLEA